ncbi:MAG TPA: hypothetical protein EYP82_04685 [Hydrogenothermaceae bacterium]|nr:hypothetical protein [Hydrogenothermaceae bacterium]
MELNKYQKEAVKRALKEDLFLIHGPFGTGKTTVLVDIILKLIKKGKRILVTADSNNAVDNLLEKLINYTDQVVRIGNLSKVSEKASLFYLDNLIKTESIYEKIKEVKERMEKVLKKRDKYLKPKPSLKRGLSEKDILRLAFLGAVAGSFIIAFLKKVLSLLIPIYFVDVIVRYKAFYFIFEVAKCLYYIRFKGFVIVNA